MSRKTMDQINRRDIGPPKGLYNLWPVPDTTYQQNDDTRAQKLIDGLPEPNWARDLVPWDKPAHLADATDDFTDALWGINEGKRDATNRR